ncbi:phage tail tube protein [Streptomyces sp. ME18-1-4]|uniref:phage tail tube protein n=1 Tax=Streptomyces sp. ME18-1-4 TaxID=3028685 RepID=UPI00299FF79D|nr:phage tail tube protein [Streptomyces sp. ME18-1-4]MDX3243660.1 phage tail tube protein [Streptomyces sp. ME18-1-4]
MTLLGRLGYVGLAKETVQGTWVTPSYYLACTKMDFEINYDQLRDESYRNNDSNLQGLYQGAGDSSVDLEFNAYPDAIGYALRIIGPDTVSAGVSTTLSSSTTAGATSISTAASIPLGSTIMIDTGTKVEYATTGTPTGSGPYTIPIATPTTGLTYAHNSAVAVVSQTTHTFKQSSTVAKPTYSLTQSNVLEAWGYTGCMLSDVQIKVDPKGIVTCGAKYTGWIPAIQAGPFTPAFSQPAPMLGWQFAMTNAGATSTRGLSYDLTLKRPVEAIHASNGSQQPREVFSGVLDADISYKAIYENDTDYNLYLQALQGSPTSMSLVQPVGAGVDAAGSSLTLTTTQGGWSKGKPDVGGTYVQADFDISGIYNATDSGSVQAVLKNFVSAAY